MFGRTFALLAVALFTIPAMSRQIEVIPPVKASQQVNASLHQGPSVKDVVASFDECFQGCFTEKDMPFILDQCSAYSKALGTTLCHQKCDPDMVALTAKRCLDADCGTVLCGKQGAELEKALKKDIQALVGEPDTCLATCKVSGTKPCKIFSNILDSDCVQTCDSLTMGILVNKCVKADCSFEECNTTGEIIESYLDLIDTSESLAEQTCLLPCTNNFMQSTDACSMYNNALTSQCSKLCSPLSREQILSSCIGQGCSLQQCNTTQAEVDHNKFIISLKGQYSSLKFETCKGGVSIQVDTCGILRHVIDSNCGQLSKEELVKEKQKCLGQRCTYLDCGVSEDEGDVIMKRSDPVLIADLETCLAPCSTPLSLMRFSSQCSMYHFVINSGCSETCAGAALKSLEDKCHNLGCKFEDCRKDL